MQLTVRDVARMLNVTENAVYRWVSDDDLPAERINGQYRFNRADLLEWATHRKMVVAPGFFQRDNGNGAGQPNLADALRAGGIFYNVKGLTKESVLRAVVRAMPLPAEFDREFLLQMLLSRESVGSTGIGEGLALPHPRYPVILPIERPFITLCFLEQPIPYSATSNQPLSTLFTLVCPTAKIHLALLARLAFALRDPAFREIIRQQGPAEEILQQAAGLEATLQSASDAPVESK